MFHRNRSFPPPPLPGRWVVLELYHHHHHYRGEHHYWVSVVELIATIVLDWKKRKRVLVGKEEREPRHKTLKSVYDSGKAMIP